MDFFMELSMLPDMIFFTGVPGSRWSGIAQEIKSNTKFNTTDRIPERKYLHGEYSGHIDAYFGTGMEFNTSLDQANLNRPFSHWGRSAGCKLLMSHEWPYYFDEIIQKYPNDWIQLVYRENQKSFEWWKQAGGFNITYPNYDWFKDDKTMMDRIEEINHLILDFAQKHALSWTQHHKHRDIFITTYKP
jgi:hypothetical protein